MGWRDTVSKNLASDGRCEQWAELDTHLALFWFPTSCPTSYMHAAYSIRYNIMFIRFCYAVYNSPKLNGFNNCALWSIIVVITLGKCAHQTPSGVRERHTCIGLIKSKNFVWKHKFFSWTWVVLNMCELNTTVYSFSRWISVSEPEKEPHCLPCWIRRRNRNKMYNILKIFIIKPYEKGLEPERHHFLASTD
jgi:hypothetical protein